MTTPLQDSTNRGTPTGATVASKGVPFSVFTPRTPRTATSWHADDRTPPSQQRLSAAASGAFASQLAFSGQARSPLARHRTPPSAGMGAGAGTSGFRPLRSPLPSPLGLRLHDNCLFEDKPRTPKRSDAQLAALKQTLRVQIDAAEQAAAADEPRADTTPDRPDGEAAAWIASAGALSPGAARAEVARLRSLVDRLEREQARRAALRDEVDALTSALGTERARAAEAEAELSLARQESSKGSGAQRVMRLAFEKIKTLQQKLDIVLDESEDAEARLATIEAAADKVARLEDEVAQLRAARDEAAQQRDESAEDIRKLQGALEDYRARAEEERKEVRAGHDTRSGGVSACVGGG